MARKLADSDKRTSLATGAMREHSQSVSVTVMAGLGSDSPRTPGSFTNSPVSASHRHSVMGPVTGLSPGSFMQGHGGSFVAAASAGSFTAGLAGAMSGHASSGPSFVSGSQPSVISPEGVYMATSAPGAGCGEYYITTPATCDQNQYVCRTYAAQPVGVSAHHMVQLGALGEPHASHALAVVT